MLATEFPPPPAAPAPALWARRLLGATPFLLSLVLAACDSASGGPDAHPAAPQMPPPADVAVETVAPRRLPATFEYVGQTAGSRDIEVRARVSGILVKRNFDEGRAVRKGESLYSLDAAPFRVALDRADADVAAAQARLAQAVRRVQRLEPLWQDRAVSQREYDDAVSAVQVGRAELKGAEARRAEAALNLGYTRVEAPIAGVAGRSQVSEGTLVSGPQVLLTTVTQTDPIKLRFGIADTDQMRWRSEVAAGRLELPKGSAFDVEVRLADGSVYPVRGKMLFSDTRVSAETGTVEAEAEVANPQGALKPGQFVRVRLLGAVRPNAIKVPARAVLEGPQGKFVYVMVEGKAQPRPVAVGDQLADGWIVTSGLAAGDEVIVDGMARIFFPGAPVRLAQGGAPAAPGPAQPAGDRPGGKTPSAR
jgi:membrane fusion protein (multidrug efflux system)